jgi:hypothetical protein
LRDFNILTTASNAVQNKTLGKSLGKMKKSEAAGEPLLAWQQQQMPVLRTAT